MISLTIEDLTKRFGETAALQSVNLRAEAGEIFFLLGPSGCGKTTLLRSIAGFVIPEGGRILFGEKDVTRTPPHRRNTGMMFQSYALWPHLTVSQNVAFGLEERRVAPSEITQRVRLSLASVQMEAFGARKIHQLSGGQQQRVALARALVIRPDFLLLDEPLSNLDARLRLEMRVEIRRICKESGLTAIYVTHDQKEALSIADRMAVMDAGQVRQIGKPADLYRQPNSKFVADFMGESNFLTGKVEEIGNAFAVVRTDAGAFEAALRPGGALRPGDPCTVSIRPESWNLSTQRTARNALEGRITDRIYLGEMAQYRFSAGSQTLKICEINPRFVELSPERDLFASVEPEDVVLLPA
jgi:iron(III) transport system ATP-binding protein